MATMYITPEEYDIAEGNGIDNITVNVRVKRLGWTKERAINTPIQKQRKRGSLDEYIKIAESNGISYRMFFQRYNVLGWSLEKSSTKPPQTKEEKVSQAIKCIESRRKYPKKYIELASSNGIGYYTFRNRVLHGWSLDEAATKPLVYRGQKS